jgi:hypothetical protein
MTYRQGDRRYGTPITTLNDELFKSPADWISPKYNKAHIDPRIVDERKGREGELKVSILDTDHFKPNPERPADFNYFYKYPWKAFCRGHNPSILDKLNDLTANSPFHRTRISMGEARMFADKVNLAMMKPQNELASTGYCLAYKGYEYVVYVPVNDGEEGPEVTVDLTDGDGHSTGIYTVKWFRPNQKEDQQNCYERGTVKGKEFRNKPPFLGHAVLHLKNMEVPTLEFDPPSGPLPDAMKYKPYSFSFVEKKWVKGGSGEYTKFRVEEEGTLPQGLSLDNSGVISGSPEERGTFTFKIHVEDSYGNKAISGEFSIKVKRPPPLGWVTKEGALPEAIKGEKYYFKLEAKGGSGTYTFKRVKGKGKLPPGIRLNEVTGELYGTPRKKPNTYNTRNFDSKQWAGQEKDTGSGW